MTKTYEGVCYFCRKMKRISRVSSCCSDCIPGHGDEPGSGGAVLPEAVAPERPLLVTSSGPNVVRVTVFPGGARAGVFVEGPPEGAESNAWCLLDSVRLSYEKAGRRVPARIRIALVALRLPQDLIPVAVSAE